MEINWLKYSPTENMTALVLTTVPEHQRPAVGSAIMLTDPEIEQVGFVVPPHWPESSTRIEMAGGEFCGNGAMCAAAHAASKWLEAGSSAMFPIESTDMSDFLTCLIRAQSGYFDVTLDMPLPGSIETTVLSFGGKNYQLPLVRFPGITHAIMPAGTLDHAAAEDAVREWSRIEKAEAMGIIFYNSVSSYIEPLVYVPAANTLCWERGCASGSAALGALLATFAKADVITDVRQPGGIIKVRCDWRGGGIVRVSVSGRVEYLGSFTSVT